MRKAITHWASTVFFRKAKPGGGFPGRKPVQPPQGENLSAAVGQGLDGFGQELHFLSARDRFGHGCALIQDNRRVKIPENFRRKAVASKVVEGKITGRGEKIGLGRIDRTSGVGLQDAHVTFLHEVIVIGE